MDELLAWVTPVIMLLFGIAVKRFPVFEKLPNALIWLGNLLIGIAAKLVAGDPANAGTGQAMASSFGWLWPFLQAIFARQIYETFVRPTEQLAGIEPIHAQGKVKK